jgi:hypothetical protein
MSPTCTLFYTHTPQLTRKQSKESADAMCHTIWLNTSGDSHCILLFTHIISCPQQISSSHILSSDSLYTQLCFPHAIALFQYKRFTNLKASINIYMVITFEESRSPLYNKCYHPTLICSVLGSTWCTTVILCSAVFVHSVTNKSTFSRNLFWSHIIIFSATVSIFSTPLV